MNQHPHQHADYCPPDPVPTPAPAPNPTPTPTPVIAPPLTGETAEVLMTKQVLLYSDKSEDRVYPYERIANVGSTQMVTPEEATRLSGMLAGVVTPPPPAPAPPPPEPPAPAPAPAAAGRRQQAE